MEEKEQLVTDTVTVDIKTFIEILIPLHRQFAVIDTALRTKIVACPSHTQLVYIEQSEAHVDSPVFNCWRLVDWKTAYRRKQLLNAAHEKLMEKEDKTNVYAERVMKAFRLPDMQTARIVCRNMLAQTDGESALRKMLGMG